ncbi:MAG: hypothetical protein IT337_03230 [Thermomicrobiales bacterium]|nr:hypothetical protein [Thermomicrobiales bacterium]
MTAPFVPSVERAFARRLHRRRAAGVLVGAAIGVVGTGRGWLQTSAQEADPRYAVIDLGTGAGNWSSARKINDAGQVLWNWGFQRFLDTNLITDGHVGLWRDGVVTDLSVLGMQYAGDLSSGGFVVGGASGQGLLYRPETGRAELLPGFEADSYPAAINATGAIVGQVGNRCVVVDGSDLTEITPPPGFGFLRAVACADAGTIAGIARPSRIDDSAQRAVLVADGDAIAIGAAPGAEGSSAADVNNAGQLVGHPGRRGMHDSMQSGRAFLFEAAMGVMTDLGTLPGYANSAALAVNEAGQAVGFAWLPGDESMGFRRAFRYDHAAGVMIDLNAAIDPASGWFLTDGFDINNSGEIVGQGRLGDELHAVLLRPIPV